MKDMQDKLNLLRKSIGTDAHPASVFAESFSNIDSRFQPILSNFSQLKTIVSSVRTGGWTTLAQIVDMDIEDTGRMSIILESANAALMETNEAVATVRSQLEKLRDETKDDNEKEKLKDTLDHLSELEKKLNRRGCPLNIFDNGNVAKSLSRLNVETADFFNHRAGTALMVSFSLSAPSQQGAKIFGVQVIE